jgi:SNF2 family DNA or RNA helicase
VDRVAPSRILIVCPKSVAPNWRAEATRFLPNLRVAVWQGQPATEFAATLAECDALVLNFAHLRNLQDQLTNQPWLALIIDEAQAIKNPDSQTAQAARSLKACHRLALTGTPIENKLLDLWSILAFAMPGALGARAAFQKTFGKTADGFARQRLSARVRPFLLRRTKTQVAQDLPPRIEEDLICELEGVQRDLYRAEYKKARTLLLKVKTSADLDQLRFHFLTSLLRLRQICCHPALVDKRQLKQPSAKVESLMDVLEPLMEEGNKVLIFSQFVTMLDLLQTEIRERKWTDFYLAGDTEDRGPLVDSFNAFEGAAVFLISLKAGGFGLNLTSASYVVLFDPWWNPAVESQAIDRTHRIGQKNTVIAYRLLVKGSIEEKIRELQKQKSALAIDILGEERFSQALSIDDLQYLFNADEPTL